MKDFFKRYFLINIVMAITLALVIIALIIYIGSLLIGYSIAWIIYVNVVALIIYVILLVALLKN